MTPHTIRNPDLYLDRTVQDWHRDNFHRAAWAIDIDLLGACLICKASLYLLEATTNPEKSTSIINALSQVSGVPSFLVRHREGQIVSADGISGRGHYAGESRVKGLLALHRFTHTTREHPEQLGLIRVLERDL